MARVKFDGFGVSFEVDRSLPGWLEREAQIAREAARHAMREAMHRVEALAKAEHRQLAGWKNETGNLEATITGYVAGDGPDAAYYWKGAIEVPEGPEHKYWADFPEDRERFRLESGARLAERYRFAPEVSPYVDEPGNPDEIVGILHKYMPYAGYLADKPVVGGRHVTTAALEAHEAEIVETLAAELARGIDFGGAP
jgi:hypothetical protein